jgi:hypothetical protein
VGRMTQQYLVGELSLILEELEAAAMNEAAVQVAHLRHEVETTPPAALAPMAARAVELSDRVCWDSLSQGETEAFVREAVICAELWEFGLCAGLLEEDQASN